jgi:geranylgeranyl diphosphate synthase, type I
MDGIRDYIFTKKSDIVRFLNLYLEEKSNFLSSINRWGNDIAGRLSDFMIEGKMLRGGFVFLSTELFGTVDERNAVAAATAMEFLQAGLLIHDDIIDRDISRRSRVTPFYQYKQLGDAKKIADSYHFGESMGICLGDICYFLAYDLLSELSGKPSIQASIIKTVSAELLGVGLAQMHDIYLGVSDEDPDMNSIINLYKYKTGRYTFSLPMMIGAMLQQQKEEIVNKLAKIGENLGIIFQIKDDEMSIFGDEVETGKPVGSDIIENKKTLIRSFLFQTLADGELDSIKPLFGKNVLSNEEIVLIREKIDLSGIREKIEVILTELSSTTKQHINDLPVIDESARSILISFLDYNLQRTV